VGNAFGGGYTFGYLDLNTCENCVDFTVPWSSIPYDVQDVIPLPNGQIVIISTGEINVLQPPNPVPISTTSTSGFSIYGGVLTPTGTVYYPTLTTSGGVYETCLYEYDPAANTNTTLGCADSLLIADLFYWNDTLYAFAASGDIPNNYESGLFLVESTDPLVTIPISTSSNETLCGAPTASIPGVGVFTGAFSDCNGGVFDFDMQNYTTTFECDINPWGYPYGLGAIPPGFPPPPATCACITEVGEISSMDTILCTNEVLNISNTGSNLDSDDVIEYLLFSDLTDTLESIIQTSTTPSFSFSNPPLTEGVTYYVVAIAGNELPGGGVDLTDICLDFSNVISVVWNPLPTVDFAISKPDVCKGECTEVEVILTGTPPFSLTYDTPGNAGQIETFTSVSGSLTICIPSGSPPGSFSLQAVSLTDANCLCE
jgi:hypothetical protein